MRDDLSLYEYYILLSESIDAEEDADLNFATLVAIGVNDPKRLNRWRRDSKNRNGGYIQGDTPFHSIAAFATSIAGSLKANGDAIDFARATGRSVAYMDKQGNLFDESGSPTERTPLTIIIRMDSELVH